MGFGHGFEQPHNVPYVPWRFMESLLGREPYIGLVFPAHSPKSFTEKIEDDVIGV